MFCKGYRTEVMNHINNGSWKDGYCDWVCNEASSGLSDLSQYFRPADILGVRQAIKGFYKSEFVTFYCNKSQQMPANRYGMDAFQIRM